MAKTLGLKEQFRSGQISVEDALSKLEEAGALSSATAKWFKRKKKAGDTMRDPADADKTRERNAKANAPKEHNRKWRKGRGRFATVTAPKSDD